MSSHGTSPASTWLLAFLFPLSEEGSANCLLKSTLQLRTWIFPSPFFELACLSPAKFGGNAKS